MPNDTYQQSIAPREEIVHQDKNVSRLLAVISAGLFVLFLTAAIGGSAQGAPLAASFGVGIFAFIFLFLGLTRSVLRTVVTHKDIRIHWGLWGPTIPVQKVKSVEVRTDCSRVALNEASKAPNAPKLHMIAIPASGKVADITWISDDGTEQRAWLGVEDPGTFCEIVRKLSQKSTERIRIDTQEKSEQMSHQELTSEVINKTETNITKN